MSAGTIVAIMSRPTDQTVADAEHWVLQSARKQLAADYVVYSSSTMLVCIIGNGVHGFTLDPSLGEPPTNSPRRGQSPRR